MLNYFKIELIYKNHKKKKLVLKLQRLKIKLKWFFNKNYKLKRQMKSYIIYI